MGVPGVWIKKKFVCVCVPLQTVYIHSDACSGLCVFTCKCIDYFWTIISRLSHKREAMAVNEVFIQSYFDMAVFHMSDVIRIKTDWFSQKVKKKEKTLIGCEQGWIYMPVCECV